MDLKMAALSGKFENFRAWSTKLVALMHTKGLFRKVMGSDDLPEGPTLPESPNADQQAAYDTKMQEQAVEREKTIETDCSSKGKTIETLSSPIWLWCSTTPF